MTVENGTEKGSNLNKLLQMQEQHSTTPPTPDGGEAPKVEIVKPLDATQKLQQAHEQHVKDSKPVKPPKPAKKESKEKKEPQTEPDEDFIDLSVLGLEDGDPETVEEPAEEESEEDDEPSEREDDDEEPEVDLNKEDNIKNLRGIAGKFRHEVLTLRSENTDLKAKLSGNDPVALQQEITRLNGRVKQLEPFEMVFALHQNPEFRANLIDRPNALVSEMKAIAQDYSVSEDVIQDLLNATNRRERDEILDDAFAKESPKSDLKDLKQRYDALITQRREIEKQPERELERLNSQKQLSESNKNQKRDTHFREVLNLGWTAAIEANNGLSAEDRLQELREIPGKKDHNEKVVRPLLGEAQKKLQMGMTHIEQMIRNQWVPDKAFVEWFARIVQRAEAAQTLHHSRAKLFKKYNEVIEGKKQQNQHSRPGINPPARNTTPREQPTGPRTSTDLITENFRQVKAESLRGNQD